MEQRSTEWFEARRGKVTASNFGKILTKAKTGNGLSKTAQSYLETIITELMTGQSKELKSESVQWGINQEANAIYEFEKRRFVEVQKADFIRYTGTNELLRKYVGCSPDGLIDDDGGVEVKCMDSENYIHMMLNQDEIKKFHFAQMQGCMFVTGRKYWEYVLYDPRVIDQERQMTIIRVERDETYIRNLEMKLIEFCLQLDFILNSLKLVIV
jgi:exodeoxyribonuclease (lambda-induced)